MFAIFKKELSIYFLTPFGYVFMGLFLLISSTVFVFYNLFGGNSDLYGMFGVLNFISIVLFPILTMKLLSEEKRNSTDQLLLTSPITFTSIVIGKYLAALFVFLVTLFITFIYAFFVFIFGNVSLGSIFGSYLGFILLGSAYIAISFFASSISDNQITSVILGFGILAGFLLIGFLANSVPYPIVRGIIKWLSVVNKYDQIGTGILKIGPLIYYISFMIFFILLSIVILEYKKKNSEKKSKLNKRFFIYNFNVFVKVFLVLGIIVFTNLIVDQFTWTYDMTIDKIFTLSEQSKKVIGSIKKPVNILVFSQETKKETAINYLLKEYLKFGKSKIKIEYLDAEKNPVIIKKYDLKNEGISNGNIVVECEGKIKRIHDFDIIKQNNFGYGKSFEGEAQITGGILYVTSDKFQKVYFLEGHDEINIKNELFKLQNKLGNEVHQIESLNLLKNDVLHNDIDVLAVVSPKRDLNDDEKIKLESYLDKGGRAIFLFDILSPDTKMTNFYNFLEKYGAQVKNNFVVEENANNYYANNKMYIVPDFGSNLITEKLLSKNLFVMFPFPGNIDISKNLKDNITIESLLKTSDKSWIRYNLKDAAPNKSDKDLIGPANLAVSIVKDNADEKYKKTKIIIVYNAKFITDDLIDMQGNYDFFMNSLNWLEDKEESITIRPKMIETNIMMLKGSRYIGLMIAIVILIPIVIIIIGIVVWRKRKNL